MTRVNINAGLYAAYLLTDPTVEDALNLPSGDYDVPLLLQDHAFAADGTIMAPANWGPSTLGDYATVNGKVGDKSGTGCSLPSSARPAATRDG